MATRTRLFVRGLFDALTAGFVPPSGGGTSTFLRADGTWAAAGGGGGGAVADNDYGDVTVSGTGTVWTVDALPQGRITSLVADLAALVTSIASKVPGTRQLIAGANITITPGGALGSSDQTISAHASAFGLFGNGFDSVATMDGVTAVSGCSLAAGIYTATRVCMFTTLTINAGVTLKPDGYPIYCSVQLVNNGLITSTGGNAVTVTGGLRPWAGARVLPSGNVGGNAGNVGGSGTASPAAFSLVGGTAGTAGAIGVAGGPGGPGSIGAGGGGGGGGGGPGIGNAGFSGGSNTRLAASEGDFRQLYIATTGKSTTSPLTLTSGSGGGSGGGGSGGASPGAGGASGGWMVIAAFTFSGAGTIESKGGNGANGTNGGVGLSGGGGGGGGAGGIVVIVCGSGSLPSPIVTGGAGGSAGTGSAPGANGGLGEAGGVGYVVFLN
jgi:hypothetical protein